MKKLLSLSLLPALLASSVAFAASDVTITHNGEINVFYETNYSVLSPTKSYSLINYTGVQDVAKLTGKYNFAAEHILNSKLSVEGKGYFEFEITQDDDFYSNPLAAGNTYLYDTIKDLYVTFKHIELGNLTIGLLDKSDVSITKFIKNTSKKREITSLEKTRQDNMLTKKNKFTLNYQLVTPIGEFAYQTNLLANKFAARATQNGDLPHVEVKYHAGAFQKKIELIKNDQYIGEVTPKLMYVVSNWYFDHSNTPQKHQNLVLSTTYADRIHDFVLTWTFEKYWTTLADKTIKDTFEFTFDAKKSFTDFDIYAGISHFKDKNKAIPKTGVNTLKTIYLGGEYYVTDNFSAYLEYLHTSYRYDKKVVNTAYQFLGGLKYKF